MLKNGDMPAIGHAGLAGEDLFACAPGLTKRELIAAMVMQGFAADPEMGEAPMEAVATAAVNWADALLSELERTA